MDETLEKQRRNLLVTSMLLLVIQFADVTISSDIKTSLLSLKIANPEVIVYFLYAIHIYLLTRFIYNRPVESQSIQVLYYHHRMLYLAKSILSDVRESNVAHEEFDRQMYEMSRSNQERDYDEHNQEELSRLSPDIVNQARDILNKKKADQEIIQSTAEEIEHYQKFGYRWQYPKGRGDEVLHHTIDFGKWSVFKSYIVAPLTVLLSESFSRYQLPLLISIPTVFLFAYYMISKSAMFIN